MLYSSADAEDVQKSLGPSYIKSFLHFDLVSPSLSMFVDDEARLPFAWLSYRGSEDSCCLHLTNTL